MGFLDESMKAGIIQILIFVTSAHWKKNEEECLSGPN